MEQEQPKVTTFVWNITWTETQRELLVSGYLRMIIFEEHFEIGTIDLIAMYTDQPIDFDEIVQCKPYTQYQSDIFNLFGVELQLCLMPNGDPNSQDISIPEQSRVMKVQSSTDLVNGHILDNSCAVLSSNTMQELGIENGEETVIKGTQQTVAIVLKNDGTEDDTIRMNQVVRRNAGCVLGGDVLVYKTGEIFYATSVHLSPLKCSVTDIGSFNASCFRFNNNNDDQDPESTAYSIWNQSIRPYFHDTYRPVRIGDVFSAQDDQDIQFVITEIQSNEASFNDSVCIIAPETLVFIDDPIDNVPNMHVTYTHPMLALQLKGLPSNVYDATIGFDIEMKGLNEKYESLALFSDDNVKHIVMQSTLLYTKKLKENKSICFDLKISSMILGDLEGNETDIKQFMDEYKSM
eukprot:579285_1